MGTVGFQQSAVRSTRDCGGTSTMPVRVQEPFSTTWLVIGSGASSPIPTVTGSAAVGLLAANALDPLDGVSLGVASLEGRLGLAHLPDVVVPRGRGRSSRDRPSLSRSVTTSVRALAGEDVTSNAPPSASPPPVAPLRTSRRVQLSTTYATGRRIC